MVSFCELILEDTFELIEVIFFDEVSITYSYLHARTETFTFSESISGSHSPLCHSKLATNRTESISFEHCIGCPHTLEDEDIERDSCHSEESCSTNNSIFTDFLSDFTCLSDDCSDFRRCILDKSFFEKFSRTLEWFTHYILIYLTNHSSSIFDEIDSRINDSADHISYFLIGL